MAEDLDSIQGKGWLCYNKLKGMIIFFTWLFVLKLYIGIWFCVLYSKTLTHESLVTQYAYATWIINSLNYLYCVNGK